MAPEVAAKIEQQKVPREVLSSRPSMSTRPSRPSRPSRPCTLAIALGVSFAIALALALALHHALPFISLGPRQELIRSMEEETVKLSRHLEDHDALKQEYDDLRRRLIEVGAAPRNARCAPWSEKRAVAVVDVVLVAGGGGGGGGGVRGSSFGPARNFCHCSLSWMCSVSSLSLGCR